MVGRDLFPGSGESPGGGVVGVVFKCTEMPVSDENFIEGLIDGDEDFGPTGREVFHRVW